ncbi:MOXD2 protein, partial [Chordeiles acutipennis]|nr:MOXD2 protein [Chordeiles acutipennis]
GFLRNGKQLGIICEDNKYDFRLQEIRDMKEILIIKPGDEILVECNFQTLDRTEITFVSLFFCLQIFNCF